MVVSGWISSQLFSIFDSDRIFEEMDRAALEEKMLECQELREGSTWNINRVMSSTVFSVGAISAATYNSNRFGVENWKIPCIGAGFLLVVGSTVVLGNWWFRTKVRTTRRIIHQLERTKAALRKRKQVYFSISMRIPRRRHPLILRACRLTVSAIECLVEKTKKLNDGSTWQDLYTDEIRGITMRSSGNPDLLKIEEIGEEDDQMDFEAVFETLVSVFKLHVSEYSRVVVIDFLNSTKFELRKIQNFIQTCNCLQEITYNLEALEKSALKSDHEKSKGSKMAEIKGRIDMDIGWKEQTSMALEAILESLESDTVNRSEVELALHKTLVMVGAEKVSPKSEQPRLTKIEDTNSGERIIIEKGKEERTDIDMVFEGVPLSEIDKLAASKSAVTRDVLLDGSESRRHEASLFGELQMVLEPRRTDFAKRERAALAKFYGVEENQLGKEEKIEGEETFEGIGDGGDEDPEPYDWRKDAETSAGLHHDADNDDFLKALNLRRVDDDIIE